MLNQIKISNHSEMHDILPLILTGQGIDIQIFDEYKTHIYLYILFHALYLF